jgi:hypothetical protein
MLESNDFATARELAKAETINEAYLGRVLRLTLLSPAITEAILSGWQLSGLELAHLLKPFPIEWDRQEALFKRVAWRTGFAHVEFFASDPIWTSRSSDRVPARPFTRNLRASPPFVQPGN